MKKIAILVLLILSIPLFSQKTYENGWGVGFGLSSPRLFSEAHAEKMDFGGYLSLIRNLDETNALRFNIEYLELTSQGARVGLLTDPKTTAFSFGVDYLFTLNPYNKYVKVYFGGGFSSFIKKVEGGMPGANEESSFSELSMNVVFGGLLSISDNWDLRGELNYHTISTDKFDGIFGQNGGLFGGTLDAFAVLKAGLNFYFARGPETKPADMHGGITHATEIDYDKIKKMIEDANKKPQPAEIDYKKIEEIIEKKMNKDHHKPDQTPVSNQIALVGINFDSNSSDIRPEFMAILAQNAIVLLNNPSIKIEIRGYTDITGVETSNKTLSEDRAKSVKNYLVSKGIDASRLTTVGSASANPVGDNNTAAGRFLNRRVEFKVLSK